MRMRTVMLAIAATAALVGSSVPAMAASGNHEIPAATGSGQHGFSASAASGDYYFTGRKFFFKVDCQAAGRGEIHLGRAVAFACLNGSPLPGDDYELWVRN